MNNSTVWQRNLLGAASMVEVVELAKAVEAKDYELRYKAASSRDAQGTFWGVWTPGTAPTPTGAGPHWGIEIP